MLTSIPRERDQSPTHECSQPGGRSARRRTSAQVGERGPPWRRGREAGASSAAWKKEHVELQASRRGSLNRRRKESSNGFDPVGEYQSTSVRPRGEPGRQLLDCSRANEARSWSRSGSAPLPEPYPLKEPVPPHELVIESGSAMSANSTARRPVGSGRWAVPVVWSPVE